MNDGLKDSHRTAIIKILAFNDKVERALLFGSRADQTYRMNSDVDIALFGDSLTISDLAQLNALMDALFVPQRVDLHLYRWIKNQALIEHIHQDGVELFNRSKPKATESID